MSGNSDVAEKADPASPKLLPTSNGTGHPHATASPRSSSSADQHHSPRSPFLHNLHHRLRKSSVASSSVHSSEPSTPNPSVDPVDKEEAARTARRFLLATIRNDWEWPPQEQSPPEPGTLKEETEKKNELLSSRQPVAWRTREEGPSDIDVDSDGSVTGKRRRKSSDPYKFENPDAIAASIVEKKLRRKRKIEDEMQWNDGLKLWSERRDAWTGAVRTKPLQPPAEDERSSVTTSHTEPSKRRNLSITQIISRGSRTSDTSTNKSAEDIDPTTRPPPPPQQTSSSTTQSPSVSSFSQSVSNPVSTLDPDPNAPYLPVYPPLFPTSHTLRARIKPPAYPTIYSKVVLQSLTPNVPIPLTHMIGTLVDGWKTEGNWPPQAAAQEAAAALRQKRNSRNEGAFARWRRDQDEKRRLKRVSAGMEADVHGHGIIKDFLPVDEGEVERRGFRKSLSGAVRKVFGMHEGDEDSDGGLERMGVKFVDEQDLDGESEEIAGMQGLMKEAKDAMDDNIVLNRCLVEENAA